MFRDFLVALSMANLWFVDIWKVFLIRHSTSYPYYHWKLNPAPLLLATMLDVLLLSAILWLLVALARRSQKRIALNIARLGFVFAFVLLSINLLLLAARDYSLGPLVFSLIHTPQLLFQWRGITTIYSWLAMLGLLAGWIGVSLMIHSLIFRRQRLIKLSASILLIISPFVLITFTQAAAQWNRYRSGVQFRDIPSPDPIQQANQANRILWIVFDEMDFRLSFLERPSKLKLPEFDRLRTESIFATNAYPPGADTMVSLPGLINGRLVSRINRTSPNDVMLTFDDDTQSLPWSTQPNVFSKARARGFNTGLVGWYHPYCRILGRSLTRCSWEAAGALFLANSEIGDLISYSEEVSVTRSMFRVAGSILVPEIVSLFISREDPSGWRHYFVHEFDSIHKQALTMATDPNLHLILIHYSIPHPPGIYDRYKNEFSFNSSSGYLDNLVLADRVLGELRQSMVEAGVWDMTTVLVISDHRLRADRLWRKHRLWKPSFSEEDPSVFNSARDERIPFILKLPGENEGLVYEPSFNTVLSPDLLLAILSEEILTKEAVVDWLERHRSIGESPYPYIEDE